jgi:tripartite-type tricarboxylate transporter receptor subunit TctC
MKTTGGQKQIKAILLFSAIAIFAVFFVWVQQPQAAETYPSKPIKFVLGAKAGDAYDINGRRFAPVLAKKLGVNVMPLDQLGPMSVNFFDAVQESAPDGYTLGFGGAAHRMYHVIKPGRLKYDATTLPVVAGMNTFPDVVWASTKSKLNIKTAQDLLNYKGPVKISLFSPILVGVCSLAIVAKERGLDLRVVTFESMPDSHVAMLRGDVDIGTTTVSGMPLKFIQQGHYYPLFIWGKERYSKLPDTPCSRELGLNAELEDTIQQRVFIVPAGTAGDRIVKLSQGIQATLADPEIVKWGKEADQPLFYLTAEEFEKSQGRLLKFYMKHIDSIKPFLK